MIRYMILPHPGVSAVFFDASEPLTLAEMTLCLRKLDTPCSEPSVQTLAGTRWYAFDAEAPLPENDLHRLGRLGSLYALFQSQGDLLRPVEPPRDMPFGDDLSAILKYTGKTNAQFTRLLLHIAELSLPGRPTGRIRLLDPVAGKGTTLYEALMRGWDATGVEIVQKAAHEASVYFQKYLETKKWKHKAHNEKYFGAQGWRFTFAQDKETLRDNPGEWRMVAGDSKHADRYFGKGAFDIIAGDLPYGVSHGSLVGDNLSRSPRQLLLNCLPAWRLALKKDGVLALSWNNLVFSASDMQALLESHGFVCLREPPYDALAHRVDASILRDVVVAVRG